MTPDQLVRNEIYYCVSTLVSELSKHPETFSEYAEDIYLINEGVPDYEEAAREAGWDEIPLDAEYVDFDTRRFIAKEDYNSDDPAHTDCSGDTHVNWDEERTEDYASWGNLCEEENIDCDDYRSEIYEHWVVSDWLGRKLQDKGERVVFDFFGMTVWGRSTTGQAISMDGVIQDICEELEHA